MLTLSEPDLLAYLTSPATAQALPMELHCELAEDHHITVAKLAQPGYTVVADQINKDGIHQHIHVMGLRFSSTRSMALMDDPLTTLGTQPT